MILNSRNYKLFVMVPVRFNALQSPMQKRRQKLEESLRWHEFNFDADGEHQWIKEHRPAATSTDYGKNLNDAQNLHAKQKVRVLQVAGCIMVIGRGWADILVPSSTKGGEGIMFSCRTVGWLSVLC